MLSVKIRINKNVDIDSRGPPVCRVGDGDPEVQPGNAGLLLVITVNTLLSLVSHNDYVSGAPGRDLQCRGEAGAAMQGGGQARPVSVDQGRVRPRSEDIAARLPPLQV